MTLIKSISGIRGTIGGLPGENLTPIDVVKFASAYGQWLLNNGFKPKVVIGRDARISGHLVSTLVGQTLNGLGIDVVDVGLSTTPTVEIAVPKENAGGGIIITASHNPGEWNALKLLNKHGEFLSKADGQLILDLADSSKIEFADFSQLGKYRIDDSYLQKHIEEILNLPLVDPDLIQNCDFKVAIDAVNSVGGLALPKLLEALGVKSIEHLYCEPTGVFPHNPEPLPENLKEISGLMQKGDFDVGFVVDPDVDRLAILDEKGNSIGEEYTLVLVADYVLSCTPGNTISNLSSSSALKKITEKHGGKRIEAAVGEVNVVEKMKAHQAIIGGEGNGGIIYPTLHYGRDALVGIALFLTHLAKSGRTVSDLKAAAPQTHISKNKITLSPDMDVDSLLEKIKETFKDHPQNEEDGVKIYFENSWAHIRKSNTEPIIRIYTESDTKESSMQLFDRLRSSINEIV